MSAPLPFRGQYRASWRTLLPVGRRFRRNRLAVGGAVALGVVLAGAFLAPLLARHDPTTTSTAFYQAPSAEHWFGTDNAGRDLFARVLYGARVSLRVGLGSTLVALAIGVGAGTAAGYFGRGVDALVMRATDVFLSFPPLLLAFAFVAATGQGEGTVVLVLGLAGWATMARVLRASIQTVMTTDYVAAARAMGCPDRRVIARHVLPNAIQPLLVVATIFAGTAILGEAALSFLGAGIPEPAPAWGSMVASASGRLRSAPHLLLFPGLAIMVTVGAFVSIGDGLRDALDPRGR